MIAVILRLYYGWQNSRKEKAAIAQQTIKNIEWLNCKSPLLELGVRVINQNVSIVTDKENHTFRYQY
jgi:hypothetical protein